MIYSTNLRKMRTRLTDGLAHYELPLFNVLEPTGQVDMNALIGREITLRFEDAIHCIETGKKIKKTYGEGLSYEAWLTSPLALPSIVHPELSRIHEGIALRDKEWEEAHHNQPHIVYLSRTSEVKVGVTRTINVPSRWIDQGATEAIVLAETPYRQLAGLIEVALKGTLADKTNWQLMLRNQAIDHTPLVDWKDKLFNMLDPVYESFFSDQDEVIRIQYPVSAYPDKIISIKLDKLPSLSGVLKGIKAQYLIFDHGRVFNVRAHAGYRISLETGS